MEMSPTWVSLNNELLVRIASFLLPEEEHGVVISSTLSGNKALVVEEAYEEFVEVAPAEEKKEKEDQPTHKRKPHTDVFALAGTCRSWRWTLTDPINDGTVWRPLMEEHRIIDEIRKLFDHFGTFLGGSMYNLFRYHVQTTVQRTRQKPISAQDLWGQVVIGPDGIRETIFTVIVKHHHYCGFQDHHGWTRIGMDGIVRIPIPRLYRACYDTTIPLCSPEECECDDASMRSADGEDDDVRGSGCESHYRSFDHDDDDEDTWERDSLRRAEMERQTIKNFGIIQCDLYATHPTSLRTVLVHSAPAWKAIFFGGEMAFLGTMARRSGSARHCHLVLDSESHINAVYSKRVRRFLLHKRSLERKDEGMKTGGSDDVANYQEHRYQQDHHHDSTDRIDFRMELIRKFFLRHDEMSPDDAVKRSSLRMKRRKDDKNGDCHSEDATLEHQFVKNKRMMYPTIRTDAGLGGAEQRHLLVHS